VIRRQLIDRSHKLSITRQCELMGISRSTVYYEPRPESSLNLELMRVMDEVFIEYPFFGVPGMYKWLRNRLNYRVNYKRIERLYRLMGLQSVAPKPNTSKRAPCSYVYPYLLRDLIIKGPNHVWAADITYVPMTRGFMYMFAIIDIYSRYVVGWDISSTMEAPWCCQVLCDAIGRFGKPKILNTDQGSQFTSDLWVSSLRTNTIDISMDGKNRAIDNVFIERFWRSLKYEWIYLHPTGDGRELYSGVKDYIHFYHVDRYHSSLNDSTPFSVYQQKS